MAEYRSGNDAAADRALLAAVKAGPKNPNVTGIVGVLPGDEPVPARKRTRPASSRLAAAAQMKPLPKDERNPLADGAYHDDLILWLAYKETKAMIQFDAAPASPETPDGK